MGGSLQLAGFIADGREFEHGPFRDLQGEEAVHISRRTDSRSRLHDTGSDDGQFFVVSDDTAHLDHLLGGQRRDAEDASQGNREEPLEQIVGSHVD